MSSKKCLPSFEKVQACMEGNEQYREYMLQNSHQNIVEQPHEKYIPNEQRLNFSSYDRDFNYYDPKLQFDTFFKCSRELIEKCKEN